MRRLITDEIITGLARGLDEIRHIPDYPDGEFDHEIWSKANDSIAALRAGEITAEDYLAELTDKQLLKAYTSQCCQCFR